MSLPPTEIAYEEAHMNQNQGPALYGVVITFAFVALGFVVLRTWGALSQRKLQLDDWLMLAAMVVTVPFIIAECEQVHYGIGRHEITLTPHDAVMLQKWSLVNYYTYTTSITFVKLSILALLRRMFVVHNGWFEYALYFLAVYQVLWCLGLYLGYALECQPFDTYWSLTNSCVISLALEYSGAILNSTSDVAIFLIPQPIIWRLQMPMQRKVLISGIFSIGLIATFFAVLKIPYIQGAPGSSHPLDSTYARGPALIFTALEPLLAIICACLPSIPGFFAQVHIPGMSRLSSGVTSLLGRFQTSRTSKSSGSWDSHNPSKPSNKQSNRSDPSSGYSSTEGTEHRHDDERKSALSDTPLNTRNYGEPEDFELRDSASGQEMGDLASAQQKKDALDIV